MSKFVVVVIPDEKKAYEALHAMKVLHKEGTITFYAGAVVERKEDGRIDVKQAAEEGPLGLAVGALLGGLVGVLGGPVGAAVGLATGGMLGTLRDLTHAGLSEDFVDAVTRELAPGKFAVIAELSEEWVAPLDAKMEELGGAVVRTYRDEFVDEMIQKRAQAELNELEQRKAERTGTKAEKMAAKLERHVERARQDLQDTAIDARERLEDKKAETNARIEALEQQAAKADPALKARIEKRIAELRTDLSARERKLNFAFELVEQALNP